MLGAAVLVGATGALPAPAAPRSTTGLPSPPLRDLAAARGIRIGTAVGGALDSEPDYAAAVAEQFDLIEPENAMKWESIHPDRDRYDFAAADRIVAFAEAHGQQVRGHNLAWHQQNPAWLTTLTPTRDEAIALLHDHIATVVGHYRGRIAEWDVVNEALPDSGTGLRPTIWQRWIGDDYLDLAFRFAHEADPDARLVYNDYDAISAGEKSHRVVALAARLKRRGVPIDGVGLQFHVFGRVDAAAVADVFAEAARAGLDVSITELDVGLPLPTTAAALQAQADRFGTVVRACVLAATCRTVNLWGFTDRHSWIPAAFPGNGAATPLDEQLQPKPAWAAIRRAFTDPIPPPATTTTTTGPATTAPASTTTAPDGDPAAAPPATPLAGGATYTG